MAINKVVYGGSTLIDITDTTATASDVLNGKYFYAADGSKVQGTATSSGISIVESQDIGGGTIIEISGSTPTLITKAITENGTYSAEDDDADGYSEVTVNVPSGGGGHTEAEINALVSGMLSGDLTYTATSIGRCFANAQGTFSLNFPNATSLRNLSYIFEVCQASSIRLPLVTESINSNAIYNCPNLTTFFAPLASLKANSLTGCNSVETIVVSAVGNTYQQINNCSKLKAVDIGSSGGKLDNTFQTNCTSLDTLILRGDSVLQLYNTSALDNSTKFKSDGTGGTLYVPNSLKASYQSASNWSTILGYANNSIVAIEGSYYETHYADGTPI